MRNDLGYDRVRNYLNTYSTGEPPYDFDGLLQLVLTGVENLRQHALDQDFLDYACTVTEGQAAFLRRLLDSRMESIAQQESDS